MTEEKESAIILIVSIIVIFACAIVLLDWLDSSKECEKKGGAYIRGNCVQVIK